MRMCQQLKTNLLTSNPGKGIQNRKYKKDKKVEDWSVFFFFLFFYLFMNSLIQTSGTVHLMNTYDALARKSSIHSNINSNINGVLKRGPL
jgi:hypothetical protein